MPTALHPFGRLALPPPYLEVPSSLSSLQGVSKPCLFVKQLLQQGGCGWHFERAVVGLGVAMLLPLALPHRGQPELERPQLAAGTAN